MAVKNSISPEVAQQGLYVAYAALSAMAIVPIYFASFASLKRWKNPNDKKRTIKRQISTSDDQEEEQDDAPSEVVSLQDAFTSPVVGALGIHGLYYMFTHWDKTYINYGLTGYVGLMGVLSTTQMGVDILGRITTLLGIKIDSFHVHLIGKRNEFYSAKFSVLHLSMLVGSLLLSAYSIATKHWIASNLFAFSFAWSAIQTLSLDSFKTGITLLSSLFLYDICWIYTPEFLAFVVKNVDIVFALSPLKLVFPRLLLDLPAGQAYKFMSLGLKDIAIPGLFVALCLRFDQHRAGLKNPTLERSIGFRKPYFIACVVAYLLGLGVHFYMVQVSKTGAAGALAVAASLPSLCIVPACILSVLMTASVRGEMKQVLSYVSEEGLETMRIKKEAQDRKRRQWAQAKAKAAASRYPRTTSRASSRLPNIVKEESFVPTTKTTAAETSPAVNVVGEDKEKVN
ncbi:hypothetical protein EDD11_002838 [Mortierella claussenii]|nr:hypothetical protein EDD11_002838 [Mortierella claussenii]